VLKNTISYTRKQANEVWFDEKCAKVNEEKNAARKQAIQIKTRGTKNAYPEHKKGKAARRRGFNRD
jgi:hypothetical protein